MHYLRPVRPYVQPGRYHIPLEHLDIEHGDARQVRGLFRRQCRVHPSPCIIGADCNRAPVMDIDYATHRVSSNQDETGLFAIVLKFAEVGHSSIKGLITRGFLELIDAADCAVNPAYRVTAADSGRRS